MRVLLFRLRALHHSALECARAAARKGSVRAWGQRAMLGVPSTAGGAPCPAPSCPLRLCGVTGYDGRINDVVYCYPTVRAQAHTAVVFFGGDVQDFTENMESHRSGPEPPNHHPTQHHNSRGSPPSFTETTRTT